MILLTYVVRKLLLITCGTERGDTLYFSLFYHSLLWPILIMAASPAWSQLSIKQFLFLLSQCPLAEFYLEDLGRGSWENSDRKRMSNRQE
jgi:hypothetical protein